MKILPVYLARKLLREQGNMDREVDCLSGLSLKALAPGHKMKSLKRKAAVCLIGSLSFPAGTPTDWVASNGVRVVCWRGQVNHFHTVYEDGVDKKVEAGWDPRGLCVAVGKTLGASRRALREFLEKFPPVDRCTEAYYLRTLVREGD